MKKKIETWLIFIFLTVFTMGTIYPILNIIGISLRKDNAFQSKSLAFISANSGWDSYLKLLTETQFLIWLKNSIVISIAVTILGVALASTSAYALSRYKFKGRQLGMTSLLTTQMFPATMLLLPFFILLNPFTIVTVYRDVLNIDFLFFYP